MAVRLRDTGFHHCFYARVACLHCWIFPLYFIHQVCNLSCQLCIPIWHSQNPYSQHAIIEMQACHRDRMPSRHVHLAEPNLMQSVILLQRLPMQLSHGGWKGTRWGCTYHCSQSHGSWRETGWGWFPPTTPAFPQPLLLRCPTA